MAEMGCVALGIGIRSFVLIVVSDFNHPAARLAPVAWLALNRG